MTAAFEMDPAGAAPASIDAALHLAADRIGAGAEGFRSDTPRLDAEILLAALLARSRAQLLADLREPLPPGVWPRYAAWTRRRAAGEPVAYLLGRASFHAIELEVTPDVLIPRSETEMLVDWALDWLGRRRRAAPAASEMIRMLDVGTGSGAIILAIAAALAEAAPPAKPLPPRGVSLLGVDISEKALAVARRNALRLDLRARPRFEAADLFPEAPRTFDLILANLPYVAEDERHLVGVDVDRHEPHLALYAGQDGLDLIRRLLAQLPERMAPEAAALLEIGFAQGPAVMALARAQLPDARLTLHADLAGHDRMLSIERSARSDASAAEVQP